uniref:Amine oxidase domain-containing protein n=1 Tax=Anopheles minimus TaxID=112268 RepID=A0A182WL46_9DIPT
MKLHPTVGVTIMHLLAIIIISSVNGAENPRIIVIGAGAAGIATASRLYQQGLKNVTILEASHRIGGRVASTLFAGGVVELGAQWCHGEKDNVVYEMASVYPELLKSSIVTDGPALIRSNGVRIDNKIVEKVAVLAEEIIESNERKAYAGSLGDFFAEKYWSRLQSDANYSDVNRELAEQFLDFFHNYERGYSAYDSWFEVAANESDGYQESEGNPTLAWNSEKGYSIILDIVSGNYPGTMNATLTPVPLSQIVTFGKFVSNIQWDESSNQNVRITTDDGSQYEADHVVVTVPLGVLKENHQTMFTPALPAINQQAITGIYFGTVNKVYLLFDTPIPEEVPNTISLLWYGSDLEVLRRSEHAWAEAVSTFFRVDHHPYVLAAWLNGIEGRQAELLADDAIRDGLMHLLSIFAGNITFGNVEDVLRSKWSSNRLFRGSYSSRSITTEKLGTGAQHLSTPLTDADRNPVILFAGEATSHDHYSTVHGAIESGYREANRLLKLYHMKWSTALIGIFVYLSTVNGAENPRIIIVGAGAAGIAAASRLYQKGFKNITILEASQRLGGRIRTTPFGGGIVELGAQWCHGEQGNVVYQLASVYRGLLKSSIIADEDAVLIRSSGARVPEAVADRLQTMAEGIIESEGRDTFDGSLGEYFTQQYWKQLATPAYKDISRDLAEQFLVYYHNYERGYTAYDSWYEVAASETDSYVEPAGNQDIAWNGKKGFSTILDIVSGNHPGTTNQSLTPVPLSNLIKYGKFVSNIQWKGSSDGDVIVKAQDGTSYEADNVIVTVSLGVLKENNATMFTPALPTVNKNAITGLYFGTVNKIFVLFDAPIPEDFPNTVHLLWYKSDLAALRQSPYAWAEAVSTFFRIDNQPNVLMAWMNGAEGRRAEYLRDAPIREGILHLLKIFAKNITFGNIQALLRSKWSSDRLYRGSYSSRSITTENLNTGARALGTPVRNAANEPVLLFAGEATNPVHYSTVHGAIDTTGVMNKIEPSVVIVGAGGAGIAAATRLIEQGFRNLTILEAENRIGGRIHSVRRGNNVLDYGAQWVHGKDNNFIYDMASQYGLIEVEQHKENELYYRSNGEPVPKEVSDRVIDTLYTLLENVESLQTFSGSLGAYYDKVFFEAVRDGKFAGIDQRTCYQLYQFFIKYHNTYNATDTLHEVSGAGLLEFEDNQDEFLINWKNRGFHTLLDLLMRKLPEQTGSPIPVEEYVKFNHVVTSINWNVHGSNPHNRVSVTCTNGVTFGATHLILTVSLGVLQDMHSSWFDPPLPDPKRNAIEGLYIGTIDKMFLEFEEPFWPQDNSWHGFGLLWEPSDLEQLRRDGLQWLESVCAFFVPDRTERLLVAWIYGHDARVMEALPEPAVIDGLMNLLRKFLPHFPVPDAPTWFSRSRWYSNPHFRGSYSSRSMRSDAMQATAAELAEPLTAARDHIPIVQFAGEASHPQFYSTVQGAVASGWREADRLINLYRVQSTLGNSDDKMPPLVTLVAEHVHIVLLLFPLAHGNGSFYQQV